MYSPPSYGDYTYPGYAEAIGWIFGLLSLVPIPVIAFRVIRGAEGNSLAEVGKTYYFKSLDPLRPYTTSDIICGIESTAVDGCL